jgi:hypothetical protein
MIAKKSGDLRIKYMPAQSTVNDIRSFIKELEVQHGVVIQCMCIDYLDLLMPVGTKVSPSDLFIKDKYVSEEIRNLGKELDIIMVTASQLNRSAVDETIFDHSHISGGISKVNTADNVFGIYTTDALREQGRYQLQLMKTRSSAGVGQRIELSFDTNTLRIVDITGAPSSSYVSDTVNDIQSKIKLGTPNTLALSDKPPKIHANGASNSLKKTDLSKLLSRIDNEFQS